MSASLVKWVITTAAKYAALTTKDVNAIYWLEDTREIYKGAVPYTEATVLYSTTLPASGAQGKIYVESTTLQGSVWTGTKWKTVIQPVSSAVMVDGTATTLPVSGAAVQSYVAAQGATIAAQAVTNIVYDETAKSIKYTKDGVETAVPLSLLGVSIAYDGATGKLTLKDRADVELSVVNIPIDNFVASGLYDDTRDAMVLTLRSGDQVVIPAADLVKIYHAQSTSTVEMTISNDAETGDNVITATVKVSATANNAIVANADGLYVDKEALLTVAPTTSVGNILTVDANGHATDSGVLLSTLASITYVDGIRDALNAAKIDKTSIVVNGAAVNVAAPSEEKVVSEKAFVEMLSWATLP